MNEATMVKESLEVAQRENGELHERLSKKENDLQQLQLDYESLKVSEASALQSLRELKNLLASDSANNSNKASNLTKVRSFRASNGTVDDSMITKSAKNRQFNRLSNEKPRVHSSRWSNEKPRAHNRHGHGLDVFNCLVFDKDGSFEIKDKQLGSVSVVPEKRLPSSLLVDDRRSNRDDAIDVVMMQNAEIEKQKRKKTIFERFSDSLRRKNFLKS
ncbi:hypothetical protein HPP92_005989 [Vanilla planifolia]|uniref:Uncharacterized protein n=1 Tax=Vanilla planifolia TaxID=51239 RepID=A0A835RI68_VANPL|nr:hypothetical protein HPP92_005989 [Vanilla planifolia]